MSVVGSDNFEDCPDLPWASWSAETPTAPLTTDAWDDVNLEGTVKTAWWRVTVAGDHDPAATIRIDIASRSVMPESGLGAQAALWEGATKDTLTFINSGSVVELTRNPGDVFYIEAWLIAGDPNAELGTYVVGCGPVSHSYSDWLPGYLVDVAARQTVFDQVEGRVKSLERGSFLESFDGRDSHMNLARSELADVPSVSSAPHVGHFIAWVFTTASTDGNNYNKYSVAARREDQGILISGAPLIDEVATNYQANLMASRPENAISVEIEPDAPYTLTSMSVSLPIRSEGNSLYVRTKVRPAESYDDTSGAETVVDERLWPATPPSVVDTSTLEFSTSNIGSTGLIILRPESDVAETPNWITTVTWDGSAYKANAGHTYRTTDGALATISGVIQPPGHRWRYEHYLDAFAPPTIFGIPPLRQVQRGDGLGFSSAPRAIQNNSVQGSLRNFGFN